jgi:hypothetical protein
MSGSQLYLMVIGPIALLLALGLGFWLKKRDDAEHRAEPMVDRPVVEAPAIDPELSEALGYVKPDPSLQSKAKG